ncbi:unnamed protein product [Lepeophtheirus salmonis]|uniref:(salmon louse) hypothetical protein n=1 Tax=Lepeophtheirus salmonis TaxID=72036 RepID=A0A7R8CZL6_LEPSM|nr:unnamed protein product [Lepeophtheirus salmonis]CAF2977155.1 unnamed protein product [Lepeophtheirus salmonis]
MPGGHGNENPNVNYMNGRGFWCFYVSLIGIVHLILLSIPLDSFTVPWVWTFTNILHNGISFCFLHWTKSHPWLTNDQGSCRRLTHWEQIDHGPPIHSHKEIFNHYPNHFIHSYIGIYPLRTKAF